MTDTNSLAQDAIATTYVAILVGILALWALLSVAMKIDQRRRRNFIETIKTIQSRPPFECTMLHCGRCCDETPHFRVVERTAPFDAHNVCSRCKTYMRAHDTTQENDYDQ